MESHESASAKRVRLHQAVARQRAMLLELDQQRDATERELQELETELAQLEAAHITD
jgi:hypothetical protein